MLRAVGQRNTGASHLENNEVAGPLLEKPCGLRRFCPGLSSLLAQRSRADRLARRSAIRPKASLLSSNIQSLLTGCQGSNTAVTIPIPLTQAARRLMLSPERATQYNMSKVVLIILAILLPPLAVYLKTQSAKDTLINLILCFLFWIPGVLHALYLILK